MGGCKCTFRDCPNTTANSPGMHFFHYPLKDHERCLKWVKNADTKNILNLPFSKARNKVVCETHFRDDCFMNYKKERLVHTAVPTLVRLDSELCLDYEESDDPLPKLLSPPSQTHLIPPTEKIKDVKQQQQQQQQQQLIESDDEFILDTPNYKSVNSVAETYQGTSIVNNGPSTSNLKKIITQQTPPKILNSCFVKKVKNHAVYIRENPSVETFSGVNVVLNEEVDLDQVNPIGVTDNVETVQNNCSEEEEDDDYLSEEIRNDDFHVTVASNQIVATNKNNPQKRRFQEDARVDITKNSQNNQTVDPPVIKKYYGGKTNKMITNKVNETSIQKTSNVLLKTTQNNKNIITEKSEPNTNAEKTINEFDYFEKRIKDLEEELEKEKNKNKIKENSQAQVGTISTSRQQLNSNSTLPLTKAQLFNGIKKYLSPSMTTLVRMEMFGGPDREWKTDEKQVSVELLRLGDDIFKYLRDEWRFRLPPIKSVEKWLNECNNEENEEDL